MEWLNYHHLLYFWTVVREGSVTAASKRLRLAQPTVSGQLHQLEEALGEKLFSRKGRKLELTEVGQVVYRYADEIFALGRELQETLKGQPTGRPQRLAVGIADVVPKLITHRLLEPVLRLPTPTRLICLEDKPERLLADLALHNLDLVVSDAPAVATVRAFSHLLGESSVSVFAPPKLAARLRKGFPASRDGAPLLMPAEMSSLRRSLERWFDEVQVRPAIVAEFEDSALAHVFAQAGAGAFASSSAIEAEISAQYRVEPVGRIDTIRERYFAITVERRIQHPAAQAISELARRELFAGGRSTRS